MAKSAMVNSGVPVTGGSSKLSRVVTDRSGELALRRDVVAERRFGDPFGARNAPPPADYYRTIHLEYWFAALSAGALAWAAMLTRL